MKGKNHQNKGQNHPDPCQSQDQSDQQIHTNQWVILKRILSLTKPYRLFLVFSFFSAIASVILSLSIPILAGHAIDHMFGPGNVNFTAIQGILTQMGMVILLSALLQWWMTYCTNKITFYSVRDLRNRAFDRLEEVPLRFLDRTSHGDVIHTMINDIDQISDGLLQGFAQLLTGVTTIIGTLILMMTIQVRIALLVVALTPISILVATFISKKTYRKYREQAGLRSELGSLAEEMLGNQKTVSAFRYEDRAIERFEEINGRLYTTGVMAQFYSAITNPGTRFVNGLVYAAVGLVGALSVINGAFSIGLLSSFLTYANQYMRPFNEISGVVAELQAAFASAARVFALLDETPEEPDTDLLDELNCDGSIQVEDVSFRYVPEHPLIENFNLTVLPGQRIAIVGPTGCGKTTIINLLMRFYDVDEGRIGVSGIDVRAMKRHTLRSSYGMVLQETWLFHGTIRDNIAYGREDASEEEVREAAKNAFAHSFIMRLPQGYDTVISEDGENISQGQKQLLCIARIMLTKPPMLILDEATSNIDVRTEVRIQKAFQSLMEGRTSFIIAHRLSTIQDADTILVMDKGHIIEKGNHEELMKKGGFYANLYKSQFISVS